MLPPASDQDLGLLQRVEDLPVQQLIPELAVEGLVISVLPRRARFDIERFHTDPAQPVAHGMGGKLRAIVRTDMIGRAMALEQIGEDGEHVIALELSLDMDRQALTAMLIDHRKHAERLPVMRPIGDEVVAPDMAAILGPEPDARAVIQP